MSNNLRGKTALVTGSSRGIGRAIALGLAARGVNVAVNYVTRAAEAEEVAATVRRAGCRSLVLKGDVSNPSEMDAIFSAIDAEWTGLDIYVNNAIDVAAFGPVRRLNLDAWRHTVDAHVTAFFHAARLSAPLMIRGGGGTIVALSSLGSRMCLPQYAAVGVGKAAIEALTRYLAVEFAPLGIRVNAVAGGPIDTSALRAFRNFDQIEQFSTDHAPSRRLGQPEDLAGIVAFLCSDDARWICGQTIVADGGLSLVSAGLLPVKRVG